MSPEMIGVIVFTATAFLFVGLAVFLISCFASEQTVVDKRFKKLSHSMEMQGFEAQAISFLKKETDWRKYSIFSDFPPLLNLPVLFEQAGMRIDVSRWFILSLCASAVVTITVFIFVHTLWIVALSAVGTFFFSYLLIIIKRKRRMSSFEACFSQSLEILGRSLRAGHPLTMGLQMVSTEMPEPIRTEFSRVFYEQQMGLPFDESLRRMAHRVPLLDVRFFVLSILIHQQIGGDLSEVLDNLSRVIRDRFKVLGQVKALTAEGRLSGWVLSALPIFVFLVISMVNPPYIKTLLDSELGRRMLWFAVISQIIGMLLIQKIARIKV
jgi:tight adherence protein B